MGKRAGAAAQTGGAVFGRGGRHYGLAGGCVYTRVFGEGVESRLQAIIRTLPAEELPVGEALIVPTGHTGIPWLISAPTMRRPSVLHDGDPVRRSARAAMRAGLEQAFASIAFPGMGTGTGRLPFDAAAKAMFDGMEEALFSPP